MSGFRKPTVAATPGPALALTAGTGEGSPPGGVWGTLVTTILTTPTLITSLVLGSGLFVVTGILICNNVSPVTPYLSSASGVGSNSWPVQSYNDVDLQNKAISAVIPGSQTVYLNYVSSTAGVAVNGQLYATQIG
jgi:hypothetical protein